MRLVSSGGGRVRRRRRGLGGAQARHDEALEEGGARQVAVLVHKDVHQQLPVLAGARQALQGDAALREVHCGLGRLIASCRQHPRFPQRPLGGVWVR